MSSSLNGFPRLTAMSLMLALAVFAIVQDVSAACEDSRGSTYVVAPNVRYSIDASCFTNANWSVPVPSTSGALQTSTSWDFKSNFYRQTWGYDHGGVDLAGPLSSPYTTNTQVASIGFGVVKYIVRSNATTGNLGRIHIAYTSVNGKQILAIYGHMYTRSDLSVGSQVKKGELLGSLRLYGSPIHLHFELNTNLSTTSFGGVKSGTVDPVAYLTSNPAAHSPVYRFWSDSYKRHFFTISAAEKDGIIKNDPNWRYERIAYYAFPTASAASAASPVYRFWSDAYHGHFYTISAAEKDSIIKNDPNWKYEGIAYYAFPPNASAAPGTQPVYRFWSNSYRGHFYTISAVEKDSIIKNDRNWSYEGIAWYAYAP